MENFKNIQDTVRDSGTNNQSLQKSPWNPALIATITILFSVLPGGIFHALNYERLGLPQKKVSTLISNILMFLFIFIASFRVKPALFYGLFQLIFHIGCASYFYKSQIGYYKKHISENGRKASMGLPILASVIMYLAIISISSLLVV